MTTVLVSCTREEKATVYVEALGAAGFARQEIRVAAAQSTPSEDGPDLVAQADGVLLCGGPDLDPNLYGEDHHPNANLSIVPERDALEWQILQAVRERKLPLFGVCRGMQTVNAFLGGTLYQDLALMWPGSLLHDLSYPQDALIHAVSTGIDRASELGSLVDAEVSLVNSRHHQAVKRLAPGLRPVAYAPDGVLEAMEGEDPAWWLWAVQWHPENLIRLESARALWQRFHREVQARARREAPASA
jgi:putative glutamine amidotransferase